MEKKTPDCRHGEDASRRITLQTPGAGFRQALLLGNGHMGAAWDGDPAKDRIRLSHIAFFSGRAPLEGEEIAPPGAPEAFREARRAAFAGDWERVGLETEKMMGRKGEYGTHLPVGDLLLCQRFEDENGAAQRITGYSRSLDLADGVAECVFRHGPWTQRRRLFCSHPDRVLALEITDDAPGGIRLTLTGALPEGAEGRTLLTEREGMNGLRFETRALERIHSSGTCGALCRGRLRVLGAREIRFSEGQVCLRAEGRLRIDCVLEAALTGIPEPPAFPEGDFEALLARHRADFAPLMARVRVSLGDRAAERMLDLGRCLVLSAAREDSPLPMHLQGLWNDNVACRIGWTCDYHLNVNTQLNDALCGPGNLDESRRPMLRWMEETLIPAGRKAARAHYGLAGWSAETSANPWGYASPYWNQSLSPCPCCGAWLALEAAEQAAFTGREEDAARAERILGGAVDFLLGYLTEDENAGDGTLTCGPGVSPENAFLRDGKKGYASMGCAFEVNVIRETLRAYLEMAGRCGREGERAGKARAALEKLPRERILPDGTLAEWAHDLPSRDPQHRHLSHLTGVYPFFRVRPGREAARAAENSIRARLTPYENWEDTGWARSSLALYCARLGLKEQALFHLKEMERRLTGENGLVLHPPTRGAPSFEPVWELDGNTGYAVAVCEMLLQSPPGEILLLPALPEAWKNGSARGLKARGAVRVDMVWEDGRLAQADFAAEADAAFTAVWEGLRVKIRLRRGEGARWIPETGQPLYNAGETDP